MATSDSTSVKEKNLDAPSAAPARRKYWPDQTAGADLSTPADASEPAVSPAPAPETTTTVVPEPVPARPPTSRRPSTAASPTPTRSPAPLELESTLPVEQGAVGKKRGPKPSAEPLERTTLRLRKAVLEQLEAMLEEAPRHVKKQDLVDHIFTDFFQRNPTLPETLRQKPCRD